MTVDADLREFYGSRYDESLRLASTMKGRLEAARVREVLDQHLPKRPARVADIGGGAGAHAAWLQDRGYRVELVDPIRRHVDTAKRAGLKARVGDARDLPWRDNRFDLAMLAGPLYHLTAAGDRKIALHEAARVVRPGGTVVVVAFNRHANLIGATLANQLLQRRPIVEDIETDGYSDRHDRVTASTYFHTPGELVGEMENANLTDVTIHGLNGPGGWLAITIDALFGDQETWPPALADPDPLTTALAAARMADRYPELVAASTLLCAVGTVPA
jgi:ubiquinone/menaquinone biosynthesis C-methylase UbiE